MSRGSVKFTSALAAAVLGLGLLPAGLAGQERAGRIDGRLLSAGAPVGGVTIVVNDTATTAITGQDGRFSLRGVEPGTHSLTLVLGDHVSLIAGVMVAPGRTTELEHSVEWTIGFTEALVVRAPSRHVERIIDAPGAVTSIAADEIERKASHAQVPKLLEFTPGVQVTQSGVYDYNINSRGFNSSLNRRVATLIDGRDPSIPFLGSPEWGAVGFPLDDLASVELLRGPSAALYGANASSGVLSLTTRRPRDSRGGVARVTVGQLDTINLDLRWAGAFGRGWYGKVVGAVRSHDDFAVSRQAHAEYSVLCAPGTSGDCLPSERAPLARSRTQIMSGALRLDKELPRAALLTIEGGMSDLAGPVFQTGIGRAQFLDVKRPWARADLSSPRYSLMAAYLERNAPRQRALATGANLAVDSSRTQVDGQTNATVAGGRVRYVLGASATWERLDSRDAATGLQTVLSEPVSSHREAAFGQIDWRLRRDLTFVAAGRVDANTLHDSRFSPKAALVYSPTPTQSVRVTYNEAFQVPNYSEFFLQADSATPVNLAALNALCTPFGADCGLETTRVLALGNRNLTVETIRTFEVGYKGVIGGRAFVTADVYQSRASNFVTDLLPQLGTSLGRVNPTYGPWQPPAGVPAATAATIRALAPRTLSNALDGRPILAVASYANVGRVDIRGVDLALNWYVATGWRWSASYSWLRADIDTPPAGLDALLLPNAPPHSISAGLSYTTARYDVAVDIRWSDAFRWAVGPFQGPVHAFTTADVSANYHLSRRVSLGLHAANVLDNRHWESFGGDLLRRRVLASVRYSW